MTQEQYLFPRLRRILESPATNTSVPIVLVPKEVQQIDHLKFCKVTDFPDGTKETTCGDLTRYHLGSEMRGIDP